MLTTKNKALAVFLFLAAVLLTGQARLRLDSLTAHFRDDLSEMLYLPRGDALKILACGFDAPLADALFIKSMIYYADSFQVKGDKTARRDFTYALFDVITDLSPRFTRAYQMGALFLTASASYKTNLDGCKLLAKGVAAYDALAKAGNPVQPDARWLLHTILANTYEINIQYHRRVARDLAGAAEARQLAAKEFRLAAASPGAPEYVRQAAAGYESVLSGQGGIENSQIAVLSVWRELYRQAEERGDKDILPELGKRIEDLERFVADIKATREIESILTQAGKKYLEREKTPPAGVADLVRTRLVPGRPNPRLGGDEYPDAWLALPDGSFKSRNLASLETQNHQDLLLSAVIGYRRVHSALPPDASTLVAEGFLGALPKPPLAALGQTYEYNAKSGQFAERMPEGPELPPERQ